LSRKKPLPFGRGFHQQYKHPNAHVKRKITMILITLSLEPNNLSLRMASKFLREE